VLFLTHMLNRPVVDAAGVRLGWVDDLVLTSLDLFPQVQAIVLARRGRGAQFIPWSAVQALPDSAVRLSMPRDAVPTEPLDDSAVFLRRDILDKQVVDINGRKVVRVNDLQLAPLDTELRLIGADIGLSGLLRRLSLERPVRALMGGALQERVIPWNYVEGLETEWSASVRLSIPHRRLRELPPTDIADILMQVHPQDRLEIVQHFDDQTLADTLPHLEEEMQAEVILGLSDERASDIMEILPPDEAADVLGDIAEERAERILHLMEPEEADDVRELLQYADDTAGGRMTTEFVALTDAMTAGEALDELRRQAPDAETVYYVYVIDAQERLEGVLSLRDLITADADTPLPRLTHTDVIRVHVDDDQESVAHLLNRYHLLAVPVVDDTGVLCGIVTVDDVLDVLHEEAEEDISRVVGTLEESDVLATPWQMAGLRLPWVMIGVLASIMTALFMHLTVPANFTPLLALLPLLLLLAVHLGGQGAAATQLALGEGADVREILARQLRAPWPIGFALAIAAGLLAMLFVHAFDGHANPPAVGAITLAVLVVDVLAGSLLPLALHRLRIDPTLVSRPALAVLTLLLAVPLLAQVL
jgi:Mg2+ transporter MgtE